MDRGMIAKRRAEANRQLGAQIDVLAGLLGIPALAPPAVRVHHQDTMALFEQEAVVEFMARAVAELQSRQEPKVRSIRKKAS